MVEGKTLEICVKYKNTGLTPAYNIQYQSSIMPGGTAIIDKTGKDLKILIREDGMSWVPIPFIKF